MFVAGGLYREVCETPFWDREFGSGVRAAAAISKLSPGTKLYTYRSSHRGEAIDYLNHLGVEVISERRDTDIAFAYFHPLSNPLISPEIRPVQPSLTVTGENVLRFGFLEGSAVVRAKRAIYDPQGVNTLAPFEANGSSATELALVLNEAELFQYSGVSDTTTGASLLLSQGKANVVIVKCGVRGALVVQPDNNHEIPPYLSNRIFKIGTGDIFSAVFSYAWAEQGMAAATSAEIASMAVSFYCDAEELPLPALAKISRIPLRGIVPTHVILRGSTQTLGRRYSLEEARHCLRLLGVTVQAPDLDGQRPDKLNGSTTILILSDGFVLEEISEMVSEYPTALRFVILDEEQRFAPWESVVVKKDFTTALYVSAWPTNVGDVI
ncbi:PfkB family carbohydrate kinase [Rhizobium leguminosarum]|uniref:PfkB family carbohydrate kinase n=1 Tax=Rhizobium leguminosarum TaxID=384 RepID=UPI003F9E2B00